MLEKDEAFAFSMFEDIMTMKEPDAVFVAMFEYLRKLFPFKAGGVIAADGSKPYSELFIADYRHGERKVIPTVRYKRLLAGADRAMLDDVNPSIHPFDDEAAPYRFFQDTGDGHSIWGEFITQCAPSYIAFIPMRTMSRSVGHIVLFVDEPVFDESDFVYVRRISSILTAVMNDLRSVQDASIRLEEKGALLNMMDALMVLKEKDPLFTKVAEEVNKVIPCEYFAMTIGDFDRVHLTFCLKRTSGDAFAMLPVNRSAALALASVAARRNNEPGEGHSELNGAKFDRASQQFTHFKFLKDALSIVSILHLQYRGHAGTHINMLVGRNNDTITDRKGNGLNSFQLVSEASSFMNFEVSLGLSLLPQIGLILGSHLALEELSRLQKKLEQEKSFLLEEINLSMSFEEIIGTSPAIAAAVLKVKQVAPLDATVLIEGETGTGKELMAKAVHNQSNRKHNAFITVNCAALPSQLIESELFGHEKGSFTGAVTKKIGKFEVADGGTIFLDEIGELPLELQAKLLRVLQEKEFERVGGKSTITSDVRIVAATNRNLEEEVAKGKFRADLFFRLNVFPIVVPPLRSRTDDIPLLVKHFLEKYSKRIGKTIASIRHIDMELLMHYEWPGNIRELEHMVERALILSDGVHLTFDALRIGKTAGREREQTEFKTLREFEKEHIVRALQSANGKVTGENSASQLLGINGKTLGSKMRKYGIKRGIVITS